MWARVAAGRRRRLGLALVLVLLGFGLELGGGGDVDGVVEVERVLKDAENRRGGRIV